MRIALLLLTLLSSVGCQMLDVSRSVVGAPLQADLLDALAEQLSRDAWHVNPMWDPVVQEAGERAADSSAAYRWEFADNTAMDVIADRTADTGPSIEGSVDDSIVLPPLPAGLQSATASASPPVDSPQKTEHQRRDWDGFWPSTVLTTLDATEEVAEGANSSRRTHELAEKYLQTLSTRRDLVGWNAAILLARRVPHDSAPVAETLQELVANGTLQSTPLPVKPKPTDGDDEEETTTQLADRWKAMERLFAADESATVELELSDELRAAAAEVWCRVLASQIASLGEEDESAREEALAPAGRLLQRTDLPSEVRGQLMRSLAQWIKPARIPRLENAFQIAADDQRAPVSIRRAAVEACQVYVVNANLRNLSVTESAWPENLGNSRTDPDPEVRIAYGEWLSLAKPAVADDHLMAQLQDVNRDVRDAALVSLGRLQTPQAYRTLKQQADAESDWGRETAIRGLARWGVDELLPFAADESHVIRQVVAEELGRMDDVRRLMPLLTMMVDRHPRVQQAAVKATATWSDEQAVPLLMHGLAECGGQAREDCLAELRRRTGIQETFPQSASYDERQQTVQTWSTRYCLPQGGWNELIRNGARQESPERQRELEELRKALLQIAQTGTNRAESESAAELLAGMTEQKASAIVKIVQDDNRLQTEAVFRDVLPKVDDRFASLFDLRSENVFTRREAARRLAMASANASLPNMLVKQMAVVLAHEQDRQVWQSVIQAVNPDATDEAAQLALLAINQTWPDIRILGCGYIQRHPQPEYAGWVLPLLGDENRDVQLAAVEAAGRCRNHVALNGRRDESGAFTQPGLRSLLTCANERLQFAAAVAMSRLGDEQGMQELIRLSYHTDTLIRERALREMGQTGQMRFVDHLISVGWTETNPTLKRTILSSLENLVDKQHQPTAIHADSSYNEKIAAWVQWQKERREHSREVASAAAGENARR